MFIKTVNGIEGVEAQMHIQHTENEDVKHLTYTAPNLEFTGYIPSHVALILKESETIVQPSGLTNVTEYVIELDAMGEIRGRIDDVLEPKK